MATYTIPLQRTLNRDFLHRNSIVLFGLSLILVLIFLFVYTFYKGLHTEPKTVTFSTDGYSHCPKLEDGKLNIHILAHSHDDVGWLKTFEQYYFGTNLRITPSGVQFIIDSVVNELLADKNRRFVQVEMAYFWKWWEEQTPERQSQVRDLVASGQLEIAGGAWSMNDEATTDYLSIIDNFTWGFRKITDMFGDMLMAKPRVGWQIDPFGHSREQASLFAQLGFDGEFVNRIDYQDKALRMKTKRAEFIWKTSPNLGRSTDLFTVALYNHYSAVEGYDYSPHKRNEPIVDDINSPEYNIDRKTIRLINEAKTRGSLYNTNNIFLTWGDDFTYQNGVEWFKNIDKIIKYINGNNELNNDYHIFYSTPSCFVKAVNDDRNLLLTTKEGDFFPYVMGGHSYWTGYYTSRPTFKYYIKLATHFLQVTKQLSAMGNVNENYNNGALDKLRSTIGMMQHHDATTGTSRAHVVSDYRLKIANSLNDCEVTVDTAIKKILAHNYNGNEYDDKNELNNIKFHSCLRTNVTECATSESGAPFIVTVYNPLSQPTTHYVRLPVMGEGLISYTVLNPSGEKEKVQIVPIPQPVLTIPGRKSNSTMEIVFKAENIPAFGFRSYHVSPSNDQMYLSREMPRADVYTIGNINKTAIAFDGVNNRIKSCFMDGLVYPLKQTYLNYVSKTRPYSGSPSGAYIFNPTLNEPQAVSDYNPETKVFAGELVDEIHQIFNEWVSQVIRIYKDEDHVEFEWLVGPLDITQDLTAKEVIVKYKIPDMNTTDTFYTDSNGREMIKRVKNYRDTWSVNMGNSTVSGNYYPVTAQIMVHDNRTMFSVFPDRPEGGSSLNDGELELMIHRGAPYDDGFGMSEALIEKEFYREIVVRGKHYLTIGQKQRQGAKNRMLIDRKKNQVWTFVTRVNNMSFSQWRDIFKMEYAGLKLELPKNVRIITLEPWLDGQHLLRLEHFIEGHEDEELSKPAVIDIEHMFSPFTIKSVKEMTLGGNKELKTMKRLKWVIKEETGHDSVDTNTIEYDSWKRLKLNPMQIRTFLVSVQF